MKTFACACGQPLYFENLSCLRCSAQVGFDPIRGILTATRPTPSGTWVLDRRDPSAKAPQEFRQCATRGQAAQCNWLVPVGDSIEHCLSCRLTRTIPNLSQGKNTERLRRLEGAKRLAVYQLLELGLPIRSKGEDADRGLAFDIVESIPGQSPAVMGHADGVITLNAAEADDDYRERNRERLHEPYRTILGHLRHELAHFYWDRLVQGTPWIGKFRELFGDETIDYAAALQRYYSEGPPADWQNHYISAYAASHPWEDWAETWAHYLHMRATLETVTCYGLRADNSRLRIDPFGHDVLYEKGPGRAGEDFLGWINAWIPLTTVLNEVARSMGQPDIYPFVMSRPVVTKVHFVHCVIQSQNPGGR